MRAYSQSAQPQGLHWQTVQEATKLHRGVRPVSHQLRARSFQRASVLFLLVGVGVGVRVRGRGRGKGRGRGRGKVVRAFNVRLSFTDSLHLELEGVGVCRERDG